MSDPVIVVYRSGYQEASVTLPGKVIQFPKSVQILNQSHNRVEVGPVALGSSASDRESNEQVPDVIVGSLPLVHFDEDASTLQLTYLPIPPPPPFLDVDIDVMWKQITTARVPIPRSVEIQGRQTFGGRISPNNSLMLPELVYEAFDSCRRLLRNWPENEGRSKSVRNIELLGGREDVAETERRLGSEPTFPFGSERHLPERTIRYRGFNSPWESNRLASLALAVGKRAFPSVSDFSNPLGQLAMPFFKVGSHARSTSSATQDTPISTWPNDARQCFESLVAAMASLTAHDAGLRAVPLCRLWRLYEAWVGVQCLEALENLMGRPPDLVDSQPPLSSEWSAQWTMESGVTLCIYAQPRIEGSRASPSPSFRPFHSVSSILIPDVLIELLIGTDCYLVVADAKKRSLKTAMDSADIAESGSKYIWGIRRSSIAKGDELPVSQAVIVSPVESGKMFSADSRIDSIRLTPSYGSEHLIDRISSSVLDVLAVNLWDD